MRTTGDDFEDVGRESIASTLGVGETPTHKIQRRSQLVLEITRNEKKQIKINLAVRKCFLKRTISQEKWERAKSAFRCCPDDVWIQLAVRIVQGDVCCSKCARVHDRITATVGDVHPTVLDYPMRKAEPAREEKRHGKSKVSIKHSEQ